MYSKSYFPADLQNLSYNEITDIVNDNSEYQVATGQILQVNIIVPIRYSLIVPKAK